MSMLKDWKIDLMPNGFNVTAKNVGLLAPIGFRLLPGHQFNSVLKGTHSVQSSFPKGDSRYAEDRHWKLKKFREDLPNILLNGETDWTLWKCRIQASRLILFFYSDAGFWTGEYVVTAKGHAKIDIRRPEKLGLELSVPAYAKNPAAVYRCTMTRTGQYDYTHLVEVVDGLDVVDFDVRQPSFASLMRAAAKKRRH